MSAGSPRRWLRGSSTASSALAGLALAGCGSGGEAERPALRADVGRLLQDETADVPEALAGGDTVGARAQALELRGTVRRQIAAGRVPPELRRPLVAAVDRLLAALPAPPPPPRAEEEEGENEGHEADGSGERKGEGKGEGKGKDKNGGEGDG